MGHGRQRRHWQVGLLGFAALVAVVLATELLNGLPAVWSDARGRIGIAWQDVEAFGTRRYQVRAVVPGLPADAAGIVPGDRLVEVERFALVRSRRAGESLALLVERGDRVLPVRLTAVRAAPDEPVQRLFYMVNAVFCIASLAFGVAIGLRRPDRPDIRALAFAFVAWAPNVFPTWTPPGAPQQLAQLVFHAALVPPWFAVACWALWMPGPVPPPLARLRSLLPLLALLAVPPLLLTLMRGLGFGAPWFLLATSLYSLAAGGTALAALLLRWRAAAGSERLRLGWLTGAFVLMVVPSWFPAVAEQFRLTSAPALFLQMAVTSLLGLIGLTIGVLRHGVLDLGLAITRSLVAALAALLLVAAFQVLQFAIRHLAPLEQPVAAALFGAALAALGYAAFRALRPWVDPVVDRLFFRDFARRRAALLERAAAAARATDADHLARDWVAAVDAFRPGGTAVYTVAGDDTAVRLASSWPDAPPELAEGACPDRAVRVPMTTPPADAFVLLAPTDRALAGDELAVLADACRVAGARLQSLRLRALLGQRPAPPGRARRAG